MSDSPVARRRLAGWASGGLVNAIELGVSFGYLLFFLTQVLLVPAALAGSVLFVARLWDAVTDPLMGWLSDRTQQRIPRRRWVLLGSVLLALLFPLMFLVPPDLPLSVRVALFGGAYILANTASTIFAIPHLSLVGAVAPRERRSQAMGWYLTFVRVGLLLVGLGAPLAFQLTDSLRSAFIAMGLVCGLAVLFVGLVVARSVAPGEVADAAPGSLSPWQSLKGSLACPPLRLLAIIQIVKNAAVGCAASVLAFFITIVLEGPIELVGIVGTVAAGLAAVLTPLWVLIGSRIDIRHLMIIGLVITAACLGCYMLLAADYPSFTLTLPLIGYALTGGVLLYVLLALLSTVGDSAVNLAPTSMVPDANEWRRVTNGRDEAGSSFALFSLSGKLGFAAGGFVSALILDGFGFVSGAQAQSEAALLGIRIAAGGAPALMLLACIPLVLAFPARRTLLAGAPLGRLKLAREA